MDRNRLSPYIRLAKHSVIAAPFTVHRRIIYDYEIIFVKDSGCRLTVCDCDYTCKKNNVVFLPPNVEHSFHSVKNADFVQPHIHFDAIYSDKSCITPISFKPKDKMSPEELELIQENVFANIDIPYVFAPTDLSAFQLLFFEILNARGKNADTALTQKANMLKLLELILRQFEKPEKRDTVQTLHTLPNTVKNYIDGNYEDILSLDAVANIFSTNKFTMMRRFKAEYGISIIKYYNRKRIAFSKQMLLHSNISVKALGETLHFTDAYSFSLFFKEETGLSPRKFREIEKN